MWVICKQTKKSVKYFKLVGCATGSLHFTFNKQDAKFYLTKTDAEIAMQYHNIKGYQVIKI